MAAYTPSWNFEGFDGSEASIPTIPRLALSNTKMFDATGTSSNESRQRVFIDIDESDDDGDSESSPIPTRAEYEAAEKLRLAAAGSNTSPSSVVSTAIAFNDDMSSGSSTAPQLVATTSVPGQFNGVRSLLPLPVPATSSGISPSNVASLVPLTAVVGRPLFNPGNPGAEIHTRFEPHAVHTAICDQCNKKNKRQTKDKNPRNVIQRCVVCNYQICHDCVQNGKVPKGHTAVYEEMDWDGGDGLHPPAQPKGKVRQRKRKTTPPPSPPRIRKSARISNSTCSTPRETRTVTRASTAAERQANGRGLHPDLERGSYMGEYDDDDNGSRFAGFATEEDPMDEDEVREKFRHYPLHAVGSLYGRRGQSAMRYGPSHPMHNTRRSDSGMGSGVNNMHYHGRGLRYHRPMHRAAGSESGMGSPYGMHGPRPVRVSSTYANPAFHPTAPNMSYLPGYMGRPPFYPIAPIGYTMPYPLESGDRRAFLNQTHNSRQFVHEVTFDVRERPSSTTSHPLKSGSDRPQSRNGRHVHYEETLPFRKASSSAAPYQAPYGRHPIPPSNTYGMDAGMSRTMCNGTNSPGAASNQMRKLGENVAEYEDIEKAAREKAKEKISAQSKVVAFRYEVQKGWEQDERLIRLQDTGRMKEALEQFQASVIALSIKREISQYDTAEVFQRVTGEEMQL